MDRGQAERLIPMLTEILDEAGMDWRDLDAVGVGVGPGNFTGIRISVSAARGLALGLGVPAFGVTLLEAVAHSIDRPTLSCIDGHRGMGYFQRHGFGDPAPFMALPADLDGISEPNLRCVGSLAERTAGHLGATWCPAPQFDPACTIARIAFERQCAGWPAKRPVPLYLRAPDAAPPARKPPKILS